MSEYTILVTALNATGVPFAQYGWATRPQTAYGVISLESDNDALHGSNAIAERSCEGTVDLFCPVGGDFSAMVAVETVLKEQLETHYELNSVQVETENGLVHFEWLFWLNGGVTDQWQT